MNPALSAYSTTNIRSASPEQLVVALYDAVIAAIAKAERATASGDLERRGLAIDRTQAILGELIGSLNTNIDSPLPHRLFRVYSYLSARLVDAALEGGTDGLTEIRRLLESLRSAWARAEAST